MCNCCGKRKKTKIMSVGPVTLSVCADCRKNEELLAFVAYGVLEEGKTKRRKNK